MPPGWGGGGGGGGHPFLRMYLWWSLRILYLHACQVGVTVGDSGLCRSLLLYLCYVLERICVTCCICVTYWSDN